MTAGSFTFVLHSHLPWVLHHGRWPHGVDWLNEAAAESYLPLARLLHERAERGRPAGVTLGLSPVLCEQLAHPEFPAEFARYCEHKRAAAITDRLEFSTRDEPRLAALATLWERFYRETLEDFFGPHGTNLVARFRRLEERGAIEILTCGATHGYFPLLSSDAAVQGQIRTALLAHRRHFGRPPRGIWLPECGYRPAGTWNDPAGSGVPPAERRGIEELLEAEGLEYFFVDRHLVSAEQPLGGYAFRFEASQRAGEGARAQGAALPRTPYRSYRVGRSRSVSCFARDAATAIQVWSGRTGYPGDGAYLDFHKKHFPGGHRYWSVTDSRKGLADKGPYVPGRAALRIPEHAEHFVSMVAGALSLARAESEDAPILCAMFDTELFGHWWFEGPRFVGEVLDRAARHGVELTTAGRHVREHPARQRIDLEEGSWGEGGAHHVWLNDTNRAWWKPIHHSERRFESLVSDAASAPLDPLAERLMAQTARALLLLESSDWPFLITTQSARDYAERRLAEHAADFDRLATLAERRLSGGALSGPEEHELAACEARDGIFPDLEWRAWSAAGAPRSAGVAGGS